MGMFGKAAPGPTQDAYDAACRALEKHRERADRAELALAEFRTRMCALVDLLAGDMDPREWLENTH